MREKKVVEKIYKDLKDYVPPYILAAIIFESLTHKEMRSLLSKFGITYPGARLSSLSTQQLSYDLANDGYEDPEMGITLLKVLLEKNTKYIEAIHSLSPKEITKRIKNPATLQRLIEDKGMGRFILGLLTHPEGPLESQLEMLSQRFEEAFTLEEEELERKREEFIDDALNEFFARYGELKSEAEGLKKVEKRQRKRIGELQRELEVLRKKYEGVNKRKESLEEETRSLRSECKRLRDELVFLSRVIEDKEKESAELKRRLESIQLEKEGLEAELFKLKEERLPRAGIFVDVQNIYYAAREAYGGVVDYGRLLSKFKEGRRIIRALAYVVQSEETDKLDFITTLESFGYEVKTRPLKLRIDGTAKGDWDIGLAIDALTMRDKIDVMVLISGDGDFVDLVKAFKGYGVKVEVAAFPHSTAQDLRFMADVYHPLNESILLK